MCPACFGNRTHIFHKPPGGCFIKIPFRGRGQLIPSGKRFSFFMKPNICEDGSFGERVNSALRGRDFTLSWPLPRRDAKRHPFGERVQLSEFPFPERFWESLFPERLSWPLPQKRFFYETPSCTRPWTWSVIQSGGWREAGRALLSRADWLSERDWPPTVVAVAMMLLTCDALSNSRPSATTKNSDLLVLTPPPPRQLRNLTPPLQ